MQGLFHGSGWGGTQGKDEPTERPEIQVGLDFLASVCVAAELILGFTE